MWDKLKLGNIEQKIVWKLHLYSVVAFMRCTCLNNYVFFYAVPKKVKTSKDEPQLVEAS